MTPFFAVETAATLLALAAAISAIGGCISTILAIRKARDEEAEACVERLKDCRAEAERLAAELHALRMGQSGEA